MKVKANLDEILYRKIIESLIRGEYAVGEKILLDELCEKFEISRTPVVQAVKMLNKDGVLTIMKNGRVYVPEYEFNMVEQICEARRLVEPFALEKLMNEEESVFNQKVATIKKYTDECVYHYEKGAYVDFAMSDLNLHRAIVDGANNEILSDLYVGVQGRFVVVNYVVMPVTKKNYAQTAEEHCILLDYIMKHDTERAVAFLSEHIQGTGVRIKEDDE